MIKAMTLFILILCSLEVGAKSTTVNEGHLRALLTKDYGILSEVDMAQTDGKKPLPYKAGMRSWDKYWQCFSVKDVHPKYREWKDADPMGKEGVIVTMCDFDLWITKTKTAHVYHNNHAYEVTFCNNFKRAWKKLTMGEAYICLGGQPDALVRESVDGVMRQVELWSWLQIKSKKGCYSHFVGDCAAPPKKKSP